MCLHGADWNDALDMAWEKGESVAFTCAYAGNLKDIAYVLREIESVQELTGLSLQKKWNVCLPVENSYMKTLRKTEGFEAIY